MNKFKEIGAALDEEFQKTQDQIIEVRNIANELYNVNACKIRDLEERLNRQNQRNKSISNIFRELVDRLGEEI